MMVMGGVELLFTVMLVGVFGSGLPTSLPPRPYDAEMASLVPEDSMLMYMQMGTAAASANAPSETEKLLAKPSVTRFRELLLDSLETQMVQAASRGGADDENKRQLRKILGHIRRAIESPIVLFANVQLPATPFAGQPVPSGALVIRFDGAGAKEALGTIRGILEQEGAPLATHKTKHGISSDRLALPFNIVIDLAVADNMLVLALGDTTLDDLLERKGKASAKWIAEMRNELKVERPSMLLAFRVGRFIDFYKGLGPFASIMDEFGIGNLLGFQTVSGIDGKQFVTKQRFHFDGEMTGVMALIGKEPVTADDFKPVPADALAAVVLRADPLAIFDRFMDALTSFGGIVGGGPEDAFDGFDYDLRDDLLASLAGNAQLVVLAGSGNSAPDIRLTVGIKDRAKAATVEEAILDQLKDELDNDRGAELVTHEFKGSKIHGIAATEESADGPPNWRGVYWCLTDSHFILSNSRTPIQSFLDQPIAATNLATRPELAAVLKKQPFAVVFADTPQAIELAYAALPTLQKMVRELGDGEPLDFDWSSLPPATDVLGHIEPTVAAVYRKSNGFYSETSQTFPGLNLLAGSVISARAVAPAAKRLRSSANRSRSTNNMRQMMIGLHSFHNDWKAFPAAYSVDQNGKPLLSWRVHILPYLDEADLYKQFNLDEPWDSDHNKKLIAKMPQIYGSVHEQAEDGKTVYLTIRTKGAVFAAPEGNNGDAAIRNPRGTRLRDIRDGTSNTVLMIEVAGKDAVIWSKPDDLTIDPKNPRQAISTPYGDRVAAGFADGSVRMLRLKLESETWLRLFQISDGNIIDQDELR